jgi:hypothetical protein
MDNKYYLEAYNYINELRLLARKSKVNGELLNKAADFFSKQTQSIALFEGLSSKAVIR